MTPNGLLNLNKPTGITSRAAVDRVQRLAGRVKAGHAGTLDPLASGVLVVCVGSATRLIEYVQQMPKHYFATFLLGRSSPTEDIEGQVAELENPPVPTLSEIAQAAERLTGWIEQRPPAYSALKVQGRRAYELARQGQSPDLTARRVLIQKIDIQGYGYPELRLRIECGSGTYVRSLGRDLATSLGTAAVMSSLVRTAIGGFRVEEALPLDSLAPSSWTAHLLPPLRAVETLPKLELSDAEIARICNGQFISRKSTAENAGELAAVDSRGRLVAILASAGRGTLKPARNLLTGQ